MLLRRDRRFIGFFDGGAALSLPNNAPHQEHADSCEEQHGPSCGHPNRRYRDGIAVRGDTRTRRILSLDHPPEAPKRDKEYGWNREQPNNYRSDDFHALLAHGVRRTLAEGCVRGFRLHADHAHTTHAQKLSRLARGENIVHVGIVSLSHLRPARFELLGRARHDGHADDLGRVDAFSLSKVTLGDRTQHLLWTLARRQVSEHVWVKGLHEFDPAWRTTGEHRQNPAGRNPVYQL